MKNRRYLTIVRFVVALVLAIAIGAPVPALADEQSGEGGEPAAERRERSSEAAGVTPAERAELLAFVAAFEAEFAQTLDVAPLYPTRFAADAFTYDDADAFADFGPELSGVLQRDDARRRRLMVGLANVTLVSYLTSASLCDLAAPDTPAEPQLADSTARLVAQWEDEGPASFDGEGAPDEQLRRLDRFVDLTEALVRTLAAHVPRNALDRSQYEANMRWLEAGGQADVRRDETPSCRAADAVARYVVLKASVYYAVARTSSGLRISEIGPAAS